jgi:hypothetical protein
VARRTRAKEDQVLSNARRAVTVAVSAIGPALPALIILIVGAKRW